MQRPNVKLNKLSLLVACTLLMPSILSLSCREKDEAKSRETQASATEKPIVQVEKEKDKEDKSIGTTDVQVAQADPLKNQFNVGYGEPSQDAYEFTFGAIPLNLTDPSLSLKEAEPLSSKRLLYVKSNLIMTEQQKNTLKRACQHMGLSSEFESAVPVTAVPESKQVHLLWRAHYSVEIKRLMNLVLAEKGTIRCLLKIELESKGATQSAYIVFDPLPLANSKLRGSAQVTKTVEESIMMIQEDAIAKGEISSNPKYISEISEAADFKLGIKAVHKKDIPIAPQFADELVCRLVEQDGAIYSLNAFESKLLSVVPNPAETFKNANLPIELKNVVSLPVGGRFAKSCTSIPMEKLDAYGYTYLSCNDYYAVQAELGLDGACQWSYDAVNRLDPENSLGFTFSMDKAKFRKFEAHSIEAAPYLIPSAANNPVWTGAIRFINFSRAQLLITARAFNLWLAVAAPQFKRLSENYIQRITYKGNVETFGPLDHCIENGTAAAYAIINSTEYNICGAGLSLDPVTDSDLPNKVVFLAKTLMHENLHAIGKVHDYDAPEYEPCQGTSHSAIIPHNIVSECKDSYCSALKDIAVQDYISELAYSIKGERRFQGLCQTWNTDMKLTKEMLKP